MFWNFVTFIKRVIVNFIALDEALRTLNAAVFYVNVKYLQISYIWNGKQIIISLNSELFYLEFKNFPVSPVWHFNFSHQLTWDS